MTVPNEIGSNVSNSIDKIAKSFNLFSDIVDLKNFFIHLSQEKKILNLESKYYLIVKYSGGFPIRLSRLKPTAANFRRIPNFDFDAFMNFYLDWNLYFSRLFARAHSAHVACAIR